MLGNLLAACVRNLARDRLHAAISLAGLTIGFAAALLIGTYVYHERHFERFIDGYEQVYRLSGASKRADAGANATADLRGPIAAQLRVSFPQIAQVAELRNTFGNVSVRRDAVESLERGFTWADPEVFEVLRLPAAAGDLRTALRRPDSVVITRRIARKYFGRDLPIGETLQVFRETALRVTAVLEDLPSSTHLNTELFGSALALPPDPPGRVYRTYLYLRLAPGASADALRAALPAFIDRGSTLTSGGKLSNLFELQLVPIADIHLRPSGALSMKPGGDPRLLDALVLVSGLILAMAALNFVNLMTSRAARRSIEIGVRKTAGATRVQLTAQFIGEAVVRTAIAMLLAVALVELALPRVNAFVDRTLVLHYLDVRLLATLLGAVVAVGLLAGLYPALVLASFRPATALKGGDLPRTSRDRLRNALVSLQFALLIGLVIATGVVREQTRFGQQRSLAFGREQVLTIAVPAFDCETSAFRAAVAALPGVSATACENDFLTNFGTQQYRAADGREVTLHNGGIGPGLFELLGLRPVAGRFFDDSRPADRFPNDPAQRRLDRAYPTVVNETAARALGYTDAATAIGQVFTSISDVRSGTRREIIGVVPDVSTESVRTRVAPHFYDNVDFAVYLDVKLRGGDVSGTLAAIDAAWKRLAPLPSPIARRFYDDVVETMYRESTRQATLFSVFSALAIGLAAIGLLGLAAFTMQRRTREIGVRKALGAQTAAIVQLLLWQFAQPVLAANLVAWPVVAWLMARWLDGFAYHVDLPLWLFPAAAATALALMIATVAGHTLRVARTPPARALRYE